MTHQQREQLKGRVEVDGPYLGAVEEGVWGRQTGRKALIVSSSLADETARASGASAWGMRGMRRQRA